MFQGLCRTRKRIFNAHTSTRRCRVIHTMLPSVSCSPISHVLGLRGGSGRRVNLIIIYAKKATSVPITRRTTRATRCFNDHIRHVCSIKIDNVRHLLSYRGGMQRTGYIVTITNVRNTLTSMVNNLITGPIVTIPASIKCNTDFRKLSTLLAVVGSYTGNVIAMGVSGNFNTKCITARVGELTREKGDGKWGVVPKLQIQSRQKCIHNNGSQLKNKSKHS